MGIYEITGLSFARFVKLHRPVQAYINNLGAMYDRETDILLT